MSEPHITLTPRFAQAVEYAAELHRDQSRKATSIPYVSHLLGAAAFVLEQPGTTEDQAIAGLLHDAIEDQPERTDLAEITDRFGPTVAQIVADCTDADTHPKPPWRHRKVAYLAHLETVAVLSLQVSLADKLHNARAILTDLQASGPTVWQRFNAPPVAQHWYYTGLAEVFDRRLDSTLSKALSATVGMITADLPATVDLAAGLERPSWVGTDSVTGAVADLDDAADRTHALNSGAALQPVGPQAWRSGDDQWWVEKVDAGDPSHPLTVFVAPQR